MGWLPVGRPAAHASNLILSLPPPLPPSPPHTLSRAPSLGEIVDMGTRSCDLGLA